MGKILMSLQRKANRAIRTLNSVLGQELGMTLNGDPNYAWFWSEDLYRPKRIYAQTDGQYQLSYLRTERRVECTDGLPGLVGPQYFKTISIMEPHYEVQRLLPNIRNRFVLCVWVNGQSFEEWRAQFDDTMEWPKGGEYFPVSAPGHTAYLLEDEIPTLDMTWQVIRWVREDKDKAMTLLEATDYYLDNDKKRVKDETEKAMHMLDNLLPAYDNIPGRRSGPLEFMAEVQPDPRISNLDLGRMFGQAQVIDNSNSNTKSKPNPKVRADRSLVTV